MNELKLKPYTGQAKLIRKFLFKNSHIKLILSDKYYYLKENEAFLFMEILIQNIPYTVYFPTNFVNFICSKTMEDEVNLNRENEQLVSSFFFLIISHALKDIMSLPSPVVLKRAALVMGNGTGKKERYFRFYASNQKFSFHFFLLPADHKAFYKFLKELEFKKKPFGPPPESIECIPLPFPVEVGVTYLSKKDLSHIDESDIIVFDKTTLGGEKVRHAVLYLGKVSYRVKLDPRWPQRFLLEAAIHDW